MNKIQDLHIQLSRILDDRYELLIEVIYYYQKFKYDREEN